MNNHILLVHIQKYVNMWHKHNLDDKAPET